MIRQIVRVLAIALVIVSYAFIAIRILFDV
jgi:hypothetical protein